MRVFHIHGDRFTELTALPAEPPGEGFVWLGIERAAFAAWVPELQAQLQRWEFGALVDLHVSDLLNAQLPSQFENTSWYDLLVFRRLTTLPDGAAGNGAPGGNGSGADEPLYSADSARHALASIDTSPVGFAMFDRLLVTVHPADCPVLVHFAERLAALSGVSDLRGVRLPTTPADLMLRMVNHVVDSYLDLRRLLTRQLGHLQQQLLDTRSRFHDWQVLLDSRNALYLLEDTSEDQRAAVQEWIDALDEWPDSPDPQARRERELLRVRSRDVLEHIERVLTHVRRLQQSVEAAVQMHFSALGHRTNDIMRTLTALTAVFLPMNLITGFFGMNFDGLPLIHSRTGVWIAAGMMLVIAAALGLFFWRQRYLGMRRR
jgi:magnesium transporter